MSKKFVNVVFLLTHISHFSISPYFVPLTPYLILHGQITFDSLCPICSTTIIHYISVFQGYTEISTSLMPSPQTPLHWQVCIYIFLDICLFLYSLSFHHIQFPVFNGSIVLRSQIFTEMCKLFFKFSSNLNPSGFFCLSANKEKEEICIKWFKNWECV